MAREKEIRRAKKAHTANNLKHKVGTNSLQVTSTVEEKNRKEGDPMNTQGISAATDTPDTTVKKR